MKDFALDLLRYGACHAGIAFRSEPLGVRHHCFHFGTDLLFVRPEVRQLKEFVEVASSHARDLKHDRDQQLLDTITTRDQLRRFAAGDYVYVNWCRPTDAERILPHGEDIVTLRDWLAENNEQPTPAC